MAIASYTYLNHIKEELRKEWPGNRTINLVFHGHSVPAGYFKTPIVKPFSSYPHLLHRHIKKEYPLACVNAIVTAIGGEGSISGEKRFSRDVLSHQPDVITIDYSLNDRGLNKDEVRQAWSSMIEKSLERKCKIILLTPNFDETFYEKNVRWEQLVSNAEQVRELADEYDIGLCDTFMLYEHYLEQGGLLKELLSQVNHPNRRGHDMIAYELYKWYKIND
ncbi:MAG: SGNH/GDSL hydrolase family protein [Clostridia bacterium]|nr:SGNH/GDSL hydrolase family protein [Clostridia bacterium]